MTYLPSTIWEKLPYYQHDLKSTIKIFCQKHDINWEYTHETWVQEEEYKWDTSWEKVEEKLWKKYKAFRKASKSEEM